MSRRGRSTLEAWEQRLIDQREAVEVTARCAWCEWQLDGTVKATREAYAAHRKEEHPEVKVKARQPRKRLHRLKVSLGADLEENIANARAAGAAGWASDNPEWRAA